MIILLTSHDRAAGIYGRMVPRPAVHYLRSGHRDGKKGSDFTEPFVFCVFRRSLWDY
jgi:hypothetical protein